MREVVSAGRLAHRSAARPRCRATTARIVAESIDRVGLAPSPTRRCARSPAGCSSARSSPRRSPGQPSLLVLDEPTTGVDAESQESLAELLGRPPPRARRHDPLRLARVRRGRALSSSGSCSSARTIVFDGPPQRSPGRLARPGAHVHARDVSSCASRSRAGAIVGVLAPAVGFFLVQRRQSPDRRRHRPRRVRRRRRRLLLGVSPVLTALVAAVLGGARDRAGCARADARRATRRSRSSSTRASRSASCSSSQAGALNVNLFQFLFGSILTVDPRATSRSIAAARRRSGSRPIAPALPRARRASSLDEEGAGSPACRSRSLNVVARRARRAHGRALDADRRDPPRSRR